MNVESTPRTEKCGGCIYFKTTYMTGEDVGSIVKEAHGPKEEFVIIKMGLCRTNGGLRLGVRSAEANCSQPPGIFSPKTPAPETVSSEKM